MSSRTTTVIVASAAAIGVIADQLFHAPVWGINLPIAAGLLAAAGWAMPGDQQRSPWPWIASVSFASMWAVRDSEPLLAMDLMAALALASLPLLREAGVRLRSSGLFDLATAPIRSAWTISVGTFDFLPRLRDHLPAQPEASRARAVGVGALLTVPLILVFGSIFASADPVFDAAVGSIFNVDIELLVEHGILIGGLTWASLGYLWHVAKPARTAEPLITPPQLGGLQVMTPVVATAALFAIFLSVQATSLFGGASFVESTTGLTYAEYARGGFFQLVFASALVLPLVYYAPVVAGPLDTQTGGRLRLLLFVQLGLTALVLASALWRMGLYVQMYGLTEDRVFGTMVMLWIAGTLGVFAFTVARGRPQAAAFGSLISAVIALGALNLVNPKATIARFNLTHQTGREIDFKHLAEMGGDAVPILAANIALVPETERCEIVSRIRKQYVPVEGDWRGWNLGRARAHEAALRLPPMGACPKEPAPPA